MAAAGYFIPYGVADDRFVNHGQRTSLTEVAPEVIP
jgi:hypothetical protein